MTTPKIDPDAPAFPNAEGENPHGYIWPSTGLTVRAHFAAMAMQGMLADSTRN